MYTTEISQYASTKLLIKAKKHQADGGRFTDSKRDTSTGFEYEYSVMIMLEHYGFQIVRYAPYAKGTKHAILTKEELSLINRTAFLNLSDDEILQPLVVIDFPFHNDYTEKPGKSEFAIFIGGRRVGRIEVKCMNRGGSVVEKLELHYYRIDSNAYYPEPLLIYVLGGSYFDEEKIAHHKRKLKEAGGNSKSVEVVSFEEFCTERMKNVIFSHTEQK
jgi:hypothetical protein